MLNRVLGSEVRVISTRSGDPLSEWRQDNMAELEGDGILDPGFVWLQPIYSRASLSVIAAP